MSDVPCSSQIVIVFKGNPLQGLSWEYQSLEAMIPNCQGCMVADSVYKLYMAVKKATNDFEVAKKAVKVSFVSQNLAPGCHQAPGRQAQGRER